MGFEKIEGEKSMIQTCLLEDISGILASLESLSKLCLAS